MIRYGIESHIHIEQRATTTTTKKRLNQINLSDKLWSNKAAHTQKAATECFSHFHNKS